MPRSRTGCVLAAVGARFEPPDFCRLPILFTTLVAAELVVMVLWLAPGQPLATESLFAASALALWLALVSAVLLCKTRPWLAALPAPAGALLAWALPVLSCLAGGALVAELDQVLVGPLRGSRDFTMEDAWRSAAIAAVLGAFLLRYFHVQELWLRNERAQARAAVDALQARIRPHFLFNSMNSIAGLVRRDPDTAERAVEDLCDLFRAALGAGDGMCSLEEELALCRQYLAIEKLRLAERLDVDWRVDAALAAAARVPRLSIQPLLENAVHHGIARLPRGGRIEVTVERSGRGLRIDIVNPSPPAQQASPGNQHALGSVAQRLAYHFGDAAKMTRGHEDGYYRCSLLIPLQEPAGHARPDR